MLSEHLYNRVIDFCVKHKMRFVDYYLNSKGTMVIYTRAIKNNKLQFWELSCLNPLQARKIG